MKEKLPPALRRIAGVLAEDKITVHAAQASFFCVISAVPFLSLLISIAGLMIPADLGSFLRSIPIPENMVAFAGIVLKDIQSTPSIPLLSLSAVTALWTASKGTAAIRAGLETVYQAESSHGFLVRRLHSLGNTLLFIALLIALILVLLFGDSLAGWIPIPQLADLILSLRYPVSFLFMCAVFCLAYASIARRSRVLPASLRVPLPGAVFSAVGWVLFSFFYSLYVTCFPNAASVYGGLAAVCLLMLWVYFCLIILLLGAECNKLLYAGVPPALPEKGR